MKTVRFILASLITTASMFALAEDNSATITEEQYRKAIASFGVSNQTAEIASKEAVRLIEKRLSPETKNKTTSMAELPTNWLESSPY